MARQDELERIEKTANCTRELLDETLAAGAGQEEGIMRTLRALAVLIGDLARTLK